MTEATPKFIDLKIPKVVYRKIYIQNLPQKLEGLTSYTFPQQIIVLLETILSAAVTPDNEKRPLHYMLK